jgi:hypothetical protein
MRRRKAKGPQYKAGYLAEMPQTSERQATDSEYLTNQNKYAMHDGPNEMAKPEQRVEMPVNERHELERT